MNAARDVLGVIIAGGASSRFGSPKALARVGGDRVVDRVARALREALGHDELVAIVNDAGLARAIGLPQRPDVRAGFGAVGGLHSALCHARDTGRAGVLAAACDMPFLSVELLRAILGLRTRHDAVLPESDGPRGVEPLCAWYGVRCIAAVEDALDGGDARMIGFHADLDVQRLGLERVRSFGDPARLFMNLNTPTDLERAEQLARSER